MLDIPIRTVRQVLRNILCCYPYKRIHIQQLLPADLEECGSFALRNFLTGWKVKDEWPWNIMWSDKAHFFLQGSVNTQNCRIENSFQLQPLPFQSKKTTGWCGIAAAFIVGPFIFEKITHVSLITCTVTGKQHKAFLHNHMSFHISATSVYIAQ